MSNSIILKLKTKLKKIIDSKNVPINQLAINSDISDACIRNWFSKRNYCPSLEALCKVCDALNIEIWQLFIDETQKVFPLTKEQFELLSSWDELQNKQKDAISVIIKSYK